MLHLIFDNSITITVNDVQYVVDGSSLVSSLKFDKLYRGDELIDQKLTFDNAKIVNGSILRSDTNDYGLQVFVFMVLILCSIFVGKHLFN